MEGEGSGEDEEGEEWEEEGEEEEEEEDEEDEEDEARSLTRLIIASPEDAPQERHLIVRLMYHA